MKPELSSLPAVSNETTSGYSAYVPQCEPVPPCYPYPIYGINPPYDYPLEYPKVVATQRFSHSPDMVYPSYAFPVQTGISPVPYLYPYQVPRNGSENPMQGRPLQAIPIPPFRLDTNFNGPTNCCLPLERKRQRSDCKNVVVVLIARYIGFLKESGIACCNFKTGTVFIRKQTASFVCGLKAEEKGNVAHPIHVYA